MPLPTGSIQIPWAEQLKKQHADNYLRAANVVVIYRQGDVDGLTIANYYIEKRNIPASNVYAINMTLTGLYTQQWTMAEIRALMAGVQSHIQSKNIVVGCIVLCGYFPDQDWRRPKLISDSPSAVVSMNYCFANCMNGLAFPATYPDERSQLRDYFNDTYPDKSHNIGVTVGPGAFYKMPLVKGTTWTIPVFRLEVATVDSKDTTFGASTTHVNYVKRMIDDAIYAENQKYADFGNVLLANAPLAFDMSFGAIADLRMNGIPYKNLYAYGLAVEATPILRNQPFALSGPSSNASVVVVSSGKTQYFTPINKGTYGTEATAAAAPTFAAGVNTITQDGGVTWLGLGEIPINNFAPGCTHYQEQAGSTFLDNAYTDMFYISIGTGAYISGAAGYSFRLPGPTAYTFRKGAVVLYGMSYSGGMSAINSVDYHHAYVSDVLPTVSTVDVKTSNYIFIGTLAGRNVPIDVLSVRYTGAGAVATSSYTNTVFTFTVDGVVTTVNVAGQSIYAAVGTVHAALGTAAWQIWGGYFNLSQAGNAIKNGACIAFGASYEPTESYMVHSASCVDALWRGMAIGEFAQKLTAISANRLVYGDPLYRPFGHRLK